MLKRKRILVDKKFQLRLTFSIIGLLFFLAAIIIGVIGINAYNNNSRIERTIEKIGDIVTSQDHHIEALKNLHQINNPKDMEIATGVLSKNLRQNILLLNNNVKVLNQIVHSSTVLIIIMICAVIAQGGLLYIILIRKTNRISGPLFVITRYMKEITNGNYPDIRPLRENDEFKEMYDVFSNMVETLKKSGD